MPGARERDQYDGPANAECGDDSAQSSGLSSDAARITDPECRVRPACQHGVPVAAIRTGHRKRLGRQANRRQVDDAVCRYSVLPRVVIQRSYGNVKHRSIGRYRRVQGLGRGHRRPFLGGSATVDSHGHAVHRCRRRCDQSIGIDASQQEIGEAGSQASAAAGQSSHVDAGECFVQYRLSQSFRR